MFEEFKKTAARKGEAEAQVEQLGRGDTFNFACHPGVPCFTDCCRDLNLTLSPYDLLRLKQALGVGSGELLDEYTLQRPGQKPPMPYIYLEMEEDESKACPFVTEKGCTIYEHRPTSCRLYPVGRGTGREGKELFFTIREPHCRGFEEEVAWTADDWMSDQGLRKYLYLNDLWTEVVMHRAFAREMGQNPKKYQMFFLASYNLDMFRDFVFNSKFLNMFSFPEEEVEAWREQDEALLVLAMNWLKFSILGQMSLDIRREVVSARQALLGMPLTR